MFPLYTLSLIIKLKIYIHCSIEIDDQYIVYFLPDDILSKLPSVCFDIFGVAIHAIVENDGIICFPPILRGLI